MDISTLHSQLKTKQLSDFYVFAGPEWAVQKIYIDQISKISGNEIQRIEKLSDVYGRIKSPGIMTKPFVYVVRDDKDIMQEEKLQKQIAGGVLGKNILIMLVTTVDKRLKFYKAYKDIIVEFEPLKPPILKKYLQKEITLSDKNVDKLMEVCEYDYGRCLLEIDKINQYAEGNPTLIRNREDNAFEILLKDGTIYQPPKDAIFDFVDAVLDRKVNATYDLYQQCLEVGEAVMVMLSVLYSNAKAVLQVQSYKGNDLSKATGLTGWQIKNASKHTNKYSNRELVELLEKIQECEFGIKTGKIEEQFVMDYILINTM